MKMDELKNNYKTSSTLEGAMPENIPKVNIECVQSNYDTETASILEGALEINGVKGIDRPMNYKKALQSLKRRMELRKENVRITEGKIS